MENNPALPDLTPLHISIQGHLDQVHIAAHAICKALAPSLNTEDISKIEIGMVEAINNIINHGQTESSIIDVYCFQTNSSIMIIIEDESKIKMNDFHDRNIDDRNFSTIQDAPESGWGILLIRKCFSHSFYMAGNHKNRLILCHEML